MPPTNGSKQSLLDQFPGGKVQLEHLVSRIRPASEKNSGQRSHATRIMRKKTCQHHATTGMEKRIILNIYNISNQHGPPRILPRLRRTWKENSCYQTTKNIPTRSHLRSQKSLPKKGSAAKGALLQRPAQRGPTRRRVNWGVDRENPWKPNKSTIEIIGFFLLKKMSTIRGCY